MPTVAAKAKVKMDVARLAHDLAAELEALPQLTTAPMRQVRKRYNQRLKNADGALVLELALVLSGEGRFRWIAYELIRDHPAAFQRLDEATLERLGKGMETWGSVDSFGRTLSGPAWKAGLIPNEAVRQWAQSENRWWRRAALVSTVAWNVKSHGGTGDATRTLNICQLLAADTDDMVVKAMSWALRQLVPHEPEAVRRFLLEHDDVLAARVKREVRNKLETGLKNP